MLQASRATSATALGIETAPRLRDRISLNRGGATADEAAAGADTSGMTRKRRGDGLGTSQERVEPPAGWKPPEKPDLMIKGRASRPR